MCASLVIGWMCAFQLSSGEHLHFFMVETPNVEGNILNIIEVVFCVSAYFSIFLNVPLSVSLAATQVHCNRSTVSTV